MIIFKHFKSCDKKDYLNYEEKLNLFGKTTRTGITEDAFCKLSKENFVRNKLNYYVILILLSECWRVHLIISPQARS